MVILKYDIFEQLKIIAKLHPEKIDKITLAELNRISHTAQATVTLDNPVGEIFSPLSVK